MRRASWRAFGPDRPPGCPFDCEDPPETTRVTSTGHRPTQVAGVWAVAQAFACVGGPRTPAAWRCAVSRGFLSIGELRRTDQEGCSGILKNPHDPFGSPAPSRRVDLEQHRRVQGSRPTRTQGISHSRFASQAGSSRIVTSRVTTYGVPLTMEPGPMR
jgi:hypothetical protein